MSNYVRVRLVDRERMDCVYFHLNNALKEYTFALMGCKIVQNSHTHINLKLCARGVKKNPKQNQKQ